MLAVTAVTLLCAWASTPGPLLHAGVSQLAPFGLGALTVLGLMRNVEWSFNRIWGVGRSRDLLRTMSDYVVITLLLPFVAAALRRPCSRNASPASTA